MKKQIDLIKIMNTLELSLDLINELNGLDFDIIDVKLKELKNLALKQRKVLAKIYHPDLEHGDEAKMKEINEAVDIIMQVKLIKPRPVYRFVVNYSYDYGTTSSSATSSYSSTNNFW